jgi:hypothetical protein
MIRNISVIGASIFSPPIRLDSRPTFSCPRRVRNRLSGMPRREVPLGNQLQTVPVAMTADVVGLQIASAFWVAARPARA